MILSKEFLFMFRARKKNETEISSHCFHNRLVISFIQRTVHFNQRKIFSFLSYSFVQNNKRDEGRKKEQIL